MAEPRDPHTCDVVTQWPVVNSEDLFRDDWVVALRRDVLHRPADLDETFARLVVEHPGAAVVFAVNDHDQVACVRQYRHPVGKVMVELPAGLMDHAGEDPLAVAQRELREEAQLRAQHWELLLTTHPSAGLLQETHHIYLATGLDPAPRGDFELVHEEADMELVWIGVHDLVAAIEAGEIGNGPLVQATLLFALRQRR